MKFECPNCPDGLIELRRGVCPECQYSLTPTGLLAYGWRRVAGRFKSQVLFQCPDCGTALPVAASQCPNPACGAAITLRRAAENPKRWWRSFVRTTSPVVKQVIHWGYFLLSAAVLWHLLAYAERHHSQGWLPLAGLSVVYLAVLTLLAKTLVPKRVRQVIAKRAAGLVKLGLVCNYFSILLLIQIAIAVWWVRALMLAGLFAVSWIGLFVFRSFLEPMFQDNSEARTIYDPTTPQGRRGRLD